MHSFYDTIGKYAPTPSIRINHMSHQNAENTLDFSHLYGKIPPKNHGVLRVASININGLRAATKKGLLTWLEHSDFDVVCLQETRISDALWDEKFYLDGWHHTLFAASKAGYAGCAIYSKIAFDAIQKGLGFDICDDEGRFVSAKFSASNINNSINGANLTQDLTIASLYLPSGSSSQAAQDKKDSFLISYRKILQKWRNENKSTIICGDYNIVHKKIDIKNFSGNKNSSGCLAHERAWLDDIYDNLGYVDSFRRVRPEAHLYSWWSNRGQARQKNVGWRIDYHVCSPDIGIRAVDAWVYREQWFSDHAPVIVDYDVS